MPSRPHHLDPVRARLHLHDRDGHHRRHQEAGPEGCQEVGRGRESDAGQDCPRDCSQEGKGDESDESASFPLLTRMDDAKDPSKKRSDTTSVAQTTMITSHKLPH